MTEKLKLELAEIKARDRVSDGELARRINTDGYAPIGGKIHIHRFLDPRRGINLRNFLRIVEALGHEVVLTPKKPAWAAQAKAEPEPQPVQSPSPGLGEFKGIYVATRPGDFLGPGLRDINEYVPGNHSTDAKAS